MAIDLQLPKRNEPVSLKFKIPSDVAHEFDLYVEAAKEGGGSDVDPDMVLQAVLTKAMKKDRGFRTWLKQRRKTSSPSGSNGNGNGVSNGGAHE